MPALRIPQLESNYDDPCDHSPDHFVWYSKDGPIPVCRMSDSHLVNALRLVNERISEIEDSSYYNDERKYVPEDAYEAVGALEDELDRRGIEHD